MAFTYRGLDYHLVFSNKDREPTIYTALRLTGDKLRMTKSAFIGRVAGP